MEQTGQGFRGGIVDSCNTKRNSGESDHRLIDRVLLKHNKESHQGAEAQSDTAHIDRMHRISVKAMLN